MALVMANTGSTAAARRPRVSLDVLRPGFQGEDSLHPGDLDARAGKVSPSKAQRAHARRLGSTTKWNQFGTPRMLHNRAGFLSEAKKGDPVAIARQWLSDNASLFRLTRELTNEANLELVANNALYESPDNRRRMNGLKPLAKDGTLPHVVLFRQVFDGIESGMDGLVNVTLDPSNRIAAVTSSLSGDVRITNKKKLGVVAGWRAAAADVGWHVPAKGIELLPKAQPAHFTALRIPGQSRPQLARLVAVPTPRNGVRVAWEANTLDNDRVGHDDPLAYISYVDAQTGKVLLRSNSVQHLGGGGAPMAAGVPAQVPDPRWKVFANTPQLAVTGVPSPDSREVWCWVTGSGCDRVIGGNTGIRAIPQLKFAYDEQPADANVSAPSNTSYGNNARTTSSYASHLTPDSNVPAVPPASPRNYTYPFTDIWHTSNCNLSGNYANSNGTRNDIDAAIINLFVNYGRMHDWSYYLGFTESTWNMQQVNFGEDAGEGGEGGDPEIGQAQAGAIAGSLVFTGRDNANQITQQDGVPGVTNQYLWHPLQAGFYSPCVDGAYDMTVVGHEYTHAISNRMIGGPVNGILGTEGPKMGESWSDLAAMEYVNGYGFAPVGDENPFAVGPYATGQHETGIRNYAMNNSPLNYSLLNYDGNGTTSPHADGEIWSAANFTVRQALVDKYDAQFAYDDKPLQYACADGLKDSRQCPGNRRWIQLMFDAFLIQEAASGMPVAAESQIIADKVRYGGANQKEMWHAYASRGLGRNSDEGGTPDWTTPVEATEAQVRFRTVEVGDGGVPKEAFVFVGPYSARVTEATVARDGEPSAIVPMVPGTYEFTARADGYGAYRFRRTLKPGESVLIDVPMRKNLASETNGGDASGDGGNFSALIDDTEETNWAFLGESTEEDIEGKQVTVDLAGGAHLVKEIQVSASNRPQATSDAYDAIGQNRFATLRTFEILTCNATTGADCEEEDSFTLVYTTPDDKPGFEAGRPRPTAPNLLLRTFDIPDTTATHVRLRVLTNQCTGNAIYSVEQNPVGEPFSNPDCVDGDTLAVLTAPSTDPDDLPPQPTNTQKHRVRAAELQVFSAVTPGTVENTDTEKPPVAKPGGKPAIPTTGGSPVLPVAGLLLAGVAAFALRRARTA